MSHLHVLMRSERWAVVAKPARVACHRSELVRDGVTVADLARYRFRMPIHLVHRLDRAASGCLLIAFDPEMTTVLQSALSNHDAQKSYLAFVRGYFKSDEVVEVANDVKDSDGIPRDARSWVQSLGRGQEPRCSLLLVKPETGRYHQVRRHVRDLNHPVLGDSMHGDTRVNKTWREEHGLNRLGLHCHSLDLPLPGGARLKVTCPPPEDLAKIWRAQPWWQEAKLRLPDLALTPLDLDHESE